MAKRIETHYINSRPVKGKKKNLIFLRRQERTIKKFRKRKTNKFNSKLVDKNSRVFNNHNNYT